MSFNAESIAALRREMRQALRSLLRSPSFSVIAFATLALGIAATVGIYTVLETIVLRPLAYRSAENLVAVVHPTNVPGVGESRWGLSAAGYFYFRRENRTLEDLGAYATEFTTVFGDEADAERVQGAYVTASLLEVLHARPALGRTIVEDDDKPGAPMVAVLSHELWARRYGADPRIVGRSIRTSYGTAQVIGVAEKGFTLPLAAPGNRAADLAGVRVDLWQPLQLDPNAEAQNAHAYVGIGRLKRGVTPESAQRDLAALTQRLPALFPRAYSKGFMEQYHFGMSVRPLRDEVLGGDIVRALWILFGSVALVLVIACANVANLFLVRSEARRRESAIRTALGASRGRMALHHLSESLLLTLSAAVVGTALAVAGTRVLVRLAPGDVPRLADVHMHWTSVGVALAIAVLSGLAFAVFPMLRARVDVDTLREGGRGLTASRRQRTVRHALVVGQMSLALVLLSAAGLMLRSFSKLRAVKPGLDASGVLTFSVALPASEYGSYAKAAAFHRELTSRLASLPGVRRVGATSALPLRDFSGCATVQREGRPFGPDEKWPCVPSVTATPGTLEALGITVRGRTPVWNDLDAGTGAVVVTKALADRLWPGEDAIGKGINNSGKTFFRVVGVIPELRAAGLENAPTEAVFYPVVPIPNASLWMPLINATYVVKTTSAEPTSMVNAVRRTVSVIDARVPMARITTMESVVARSMARATFIMLLLALAAGMALLLSAVGMYGVISYVVAQRRSEIGVRMALGARVREVAGLVVVQSLQLAFAGALIGLVGALAATRLMRALLFGVSPTDPVVLMTAPIILVLIAAIASFAPARRAASVDPAEALRS